MRKRITASVAEWAQQAPPAAIISRSINLHIYIMFWFFCDAGCVIKNVDLLIFLKLGTYIKLYIIIWSVNVKQLLDNNRDRQSLAEHVLMWTFVTMNCILPKMWYKHLEKLYLYTLWKVLLTALKEIVWWNETTIVCYKRVQKKGQEMDYYVPVIIIKYLG